MTSRQRLFCHHLLRGTAARIAAERAGYAHTTIQQNLDTLLESRSVATFLARHAALAKTQLERLTLASQACQRALSDSRQPCDLQMQAVVQTLRILARQERLAGMLAYAEDDLQEALPEYKPLPQPPTPPRPTLPPTPSTSKIPTNQQASPSLPINEKALQALQSQTTILSQTTKLSPTPTPPQPAKPTFKEQMRQMARIEYERKQQAKAQAKAR